MDVDYEPEPTSQTDADINLKFGGYLFSVDITQIKTMDALRLN